MAEDQTCLRVTPEFAGARLDQFLAGRYPQLSRAAWKRLIEAGEVVVNQRPAAKSLVLQADWNVCLSSRLLGKADYGALANPELAAQLRVVFQDESLIIVDKPAGLPCHPLRPEQTRTLFNAAIALDPGIAAAGPKALEGGLVHRLDTQTSGLVLIARRPDSFAALRRCFAGHAAKKTYLALVHGEITHDLTITLAIAHHPRQGRKMVAVDPGLAHQRSDAWRGKARPATSELKIIRNLPGHTLVEVVVYQAQMHQIRAHLHAIGHPLAGDAVYRLAQADGAPDSGLRRHALHAWKLDLPHPLTGQPLHCEAPLPADMASALENLQNQSQT